MSDDPTEPPRKPLEPTEEGKRRYGPNGYKGVPCTCTQQCPNPCDGKKCSCDACSYAFSEFMSGTW